MTAYDPDVVRWGLHLLDGCSITNDAGSFSSISQDDPDPSHVEYVREVSVEAERTCVENDEIIAHAFQEELSLLPLHESSGESASGINDREGYVEAERLCVENDEIIARAFQEELSRLALHESSGEPASGIDDLQAFVLAQDWVSPSRRFPGSHPGVGDNNFKVERDWSRKEEEENGEEGANASCSSPIGESHFDGDQIMDQLQIADQLCLSLEYHKFVREEIVQQLKCHPEIYDGYIPMAYTEYLKKMSRSGEWDDHVTLQAAVDSGLLAFSGLPLPHTLVETSAQIPVPLPHGVRFQFQTLPVDPKAVADGDTITVYVSTSDPRESCSVPQDVQIAAVQRSEARAVRDYTLADALHQTIIDSGYRVVNYQNNDEILSRKYRIRLRGIDAPEVQCPTGMKQRRSSQN